MITIGHIGIIYPTVILSCLLLQPSFFDNYKFPLNFCFKQSFRAALLGYPLMVKNQIAQYTSTYNSLKYSIVQRWLWNFSLLYIWIYTRYTILLYLNFQMLCCTRHLVFFPPTYFIECLPDLNLQIFLKKYFWRTLLQRKFQS